VGALDLAAQELGEIGRGVLGLVEPVEGRHARVSFSSRREELEVAVDGAVVVLEPVLVDRAHLVEKRLLAVVAVVGRIAGVGGLAVDLEAGRSVLGAVEEVLEAVEGQIRLPACRAGRWPPRARRLVTRRR